MSTSQGGLGELRAALISINPSRPADGSPEAHALVFVAGLHRSGTTVLAKALANHPDASGFTDTGAIEDEGQFLQSVYPIGRFFGATGQFGFDDRSHMTEASHLATTANRDRIWSEWGRHWDLSKPVLVEKSPPNLTKLRFLQALFPSAHFVVMVRHPVAVSLATQKWSRTSVQSLLRHWLVCHEAFLSDAPYVRRLVTIRYEDFVARPESVLHALQLRVGLKPISLEVATRPGINDSYFERWINPRAVRSKLRKRMLLHRYEDQLSRYGYSLADPYRLSSPRELEWVQGHG